jgi:hypothetical protein
VLNIFVSVRFAYTHLNKITILSKDLKEIRRQDRSRLLSKNHSRQV